MNILIVDDSEIIRTTLDRMITSYLTNAEIHFAENVKEAIVRLNQFQFDIAILDIKMPDGSGFDVLKEAKRKPNPPVVFMLTNYATDSYRKEAIRDGADYFFDKSTDYEFLIRLILEFKKKLKQL